MLACEKDVSRYRQSRVQSQASGPLRLNIVANVGGMVDIGTYLALTPVWSSARRKRRRRPRVLWFEHLHELGPMSQASRRTVQARLGHKSSKASSALEL